MRQFTQEAQQAVADIAGRYRLSVETVEQMLGAVNNGAGSMAQFNCPELGGSGQWMRGGMTMVGDMFNHGLKSTVDSLCNELSDLLANTQVFVLTAAASVNSNQWWPDGLGAPHSSGSQNNLRYAVFSNRLAVESAGEVAVYDTLDHQINGVSQQQGNNATLTFRSQHGMVSLDRLPRVSDVQNPAALQTDAVDSAHSGIAAVTSRPGRESDEIRNVDKEPLQHRVSHSGNDSGDSGDSGDAGVDLSQGKSTESASDILSLIEKLAQLHDAGILSDEEFTTKKQELLARI